MKSSSFFPGRQEAPLRTRLRTRKTTGLLIPFAILIMVSLCINGFDLDRQIASRLIAPGIGWLHGEDAWVRFFHQFGCWLTVGVAVAALGMIVWNLSHPSHKRRNRLAVFLLLLLALGPGLVVNGIFKSNFGRPRPKQVVEFGGKHTFQPVLIPRLGEKGHAFPCGHASMGFYWIGLFVYWQGTHRRRSLMFLAVGMVHGGVMGAGRMLQGAHWFSDVVWSAGVIYLTAIFLCRFQYFQRQSANTAETNRQKRLAITADTPVFNSNTACTSGNACSNNYRQPSEIKR